MIDPIRSNEGNAERLHDMNKVLENLCVYMKDQSFINKYHLKEIEKLHSTLNALILAFTSMSLGFILVIAWRW